jgi:LysM repeat protein
MGRWERLLLLLFLSACAGTGAESRSAAGGAEPRATPAAASGTAGFDAGTAPLAGAPDGPPTDDSGEEVDEDVDDGFELEPGAPTGSARPSRLSTLTDQEIQDKLLKEPLSLGSISIGSTNAGALVNGVQLPKGDRWERVESFNAWGTQETIDALTHCIDAVHAQFSSTPPMYIGHISGKDGGHLSPHKSHQAGRDVDASYYLKSGHKWYARATATNLDRARTWAFVKALIVETDVELILMDTTIQTWLREYAVEIGEDEAWLGQIFQVGGRDPRPIIRHAKGHATHVHVRFYSPEAQELGRRAYGVLVKAGKIKPPAHFIEHKAKKGNTLGSLANRYGTTVKAIQAANGLRSTKLQMGRVYRIPRATGTTIKAQVGPVVIPPRRTPPPKPTASSR